MRNKQMPMLVKLLLFVGIFAALGCAFYYYQNEILGLFK